LKVHGAPGGFMKFGMVWTIPKPLFGRKHICSEDRLPQMPDHPTHL
jgi:hypothetical protein